MAPGDEDAVEIGEHQTDGTRVTPTTRKFIVTADAPPALGGVDAGPSAAEMLLAALAGCLTSGIAANAALFDVPIDALDIEHGRRHRLSRRASATTNRSGTDSATSGTR